MRKQDVRDLMKRRGWRQIDLAEALGITQNTQISGGQRIESECVYTLYARWNDSTNAWVIDSFEKPASCASSNFFAIIA